MKINKTELKKAIKDYIDFNKCGYYNPRYGVIMINREDGAVWTDEFYSLGHNSWKVYNSKSIISLSQELLVRNIEITKQNFDIIMEIANNLIEEWIKTE